MALPGRTRSLAVTSVSRKVKPIAAALIVVATLGVVASLVTPIVTTLLASVVVPAVVTERVSGAPVLPVALDIAVF